MGWHCGEVIYYLIITYSLASTSSPSVYAPRFSLSLSFLSSALSLLFAFLNLLLCSLTSTINFQRPGLLQHFESTPVKLNAPLDYFKCMLSFLIFSLFFFFFFIPFLPCSCSCLLFYSSYNPRCRRVNAGILSKKAS